MIPDDSVETYPQEPSWSSQDVEFLTQHYTGRTPAWLAKHLPHSPAAIRQKALQLGLPRSTGTWSPLELDLLRRYYPALGAVGIAARLPRRTMGAIQAKVKSLRLKAVRPEKWTPSEVLCLKAALAAGGLRAASAALPGRSEQAVRQKAVACGWRSEGRWLPEEVASMRKAMASGGLAACVATLPGRSLGAIRQKAAALGIDLPDGSVKRSWQRGKPVYVPTPEVDAAIAEELVRDPRRWAGRVARRFGYSSWWIRERAQALGLNVPLDARGLWQEEEDDILRSHQEASAAEVVYALRQAGYSRSENSVTVRRVKLGLVVRGERTGGYSLEEVARRMGLTRSRIITYIQEDGLPARRRRGQWWIERCDLRNWVLSHPGQIDMMRVDRFWLIDLLADNACEAR